MGDIRRKHNLYSRPKKAFDGARILQEGKIVKNYGLKNKKEIWKAIAKVGDMRTKAKKLIPKTEEEKKLFIGRLNAMGLEVKTISDVLALTVEDILNRRLQTILFRKNLAQTAKGARQLIVHKNVFVDGKITNVPSFWITKELENKISLKERNG
jgi:small subunit ribosomal protein S4